MDFKDVEKLILLMKQHDLSELQVKEGEWEFSAHRGGVVQQFVAAPAMQAPIQSSTSLPSISAAPEKNQKEITSPLVGTFYRAPSPDQAPFKEIGDRVDADDVICIVEAMKVMNEIKAGVSGVLRKILVENSSSVEYGQPLFLVEVG